MVKNNTSNTISYTHLNVEEREEIAIGLEKKKSISKIAKEIGRSKSTVSREIKRNSPSQNCVRYRANRAQMRRDLRAKKSHQRMRLKCKEIIKYAEKKLHERWSPEQIAGRLLIDMPGYSTNYESIYQWIYSERRDLIAFLARGHRRRKKRGSAKYKHCNKIPNRVPIEERPDDVNLRVTAGHWETDTAVSRQSKDAVQITIERSTRFCKLKKLPSKTADNMHRALVRTLQKLPAFLRLSITYDNGTENARHEKTNTALGTKSYFCRAYHSWEKGSVENCIGLLRRYFPKKTDWSLISQKDLDKIEKKLNRRPRKCLGFKTPEEAFVALTH